MLLRPSAAPAIGAAVTLADAHGMGMMGVDTLKAGAERRSYGDQSRASRRLVTRGDWRTRGAAQRKGVREGRHLAPIAVGVLRVLLLLLLLMASASCGSGGPIGVEVDEMRLVGAVAAARLAG